MTETWLLNETITSALAQQTVNFVSSGSEFVGIKSVAVTSGYELKYYVQQGSSTTDLPAYDTTNGWLDETYRTLTFSIPPTGDLLTWLQTNGNKQVPRKSYDLSTSAKWATLTVGNHNVQIVAKASGYRDSEKSAAVTVNKTIISAGTYKFNDTITAPASGSATAFIKFKVNNTSYNSIGVTSLVSVMYTETLGAGITVYNNTDKWAAVNTANQIITITADKEVPYKFYEWFTANANAYTPTYTIEAGTYKFADNFDYVYLPNQPLLFKSAGTDYVRINIENFTGTVVAKLRYYNDNINFDYACNITKTGNKVWLNDAYKTIILSTSQQVSAYFYKWAITDGNLVKQVEPTTEYKVTVSNIPLGTSPLEELIVKQSNNVPTEAGSEGTELGLVALNQTTTFTITQKYVIISNIYGDSVESYSSNLVNVDVGLPNTDVFEVLGDGTIEAHGYYCLTGDTLITLADYTQKRLDELTLKDKVLSYNPTTQKLEADEITYTDNMVHKTFTEYDIWTFSDETVVKTVRRHRFYNVEKQAMVYMDEWNIGEHAINKDGELIALVSHENVKEEVKHYTLFTKNQNYFANSLLSGNRYTKPIHLAVGKQVNETQRT